MSSYENLPPTPEGYARTLLQIIRYTENPESRAWAEGEICKAFRIVAGLNPSAWHMPAGEEEVHE
jgi:hypothetical protein